MLNDKPQPEETGTDAARLRYSRASLPLGLNGETLREQLRAALRGVPFSLRVQAGLADMFYIEIRRAEGAFGPSEIELINAVVALHDPRTPSEAQRSAEKRREAAADVMAIKAHAIVLAARQAATVDEIGLALEALADLVYRHLVAVGAQPALPYGEEDGP